MNYEDIYLVPKYSTVSSRSLCDTSIEFGGHKFELPICPSNMESVIDQELAIKLAQQNYFYIMHRFMDFYDKLDFISTMSNLKLPVSISVGVKLDDYNFLETLLLKEDKIDFLTVDVAHGDHELVKEMCIFIKSKFPDTFLIAGNVATPEAVSRLESWGADCTKIGVAPGKSCRTFNQTGFLSPMVETISECSKAAQKPIIADGGIREPGHIAKALVLGADLIMVGSYLAAHVDSPGEIIERDGKQYKSYSGSTANNKFHVEGRTLELPLKGHLMDTYRDIKESLQSSISYAGGYDLSAFNNVEWRRI